MPFHPRARQAALVFIFITLTLDMLAIGVVVPVLPKLIVEMSGASVAAAAHWVGFSGTLWALAQFVSMPMVGALSDKIGRRPIVLISNFGQAADYAFMALAPNLWWLLAGRMISGFCASSVSTAFAYVADVTAPEKRAGAFGMLGAAFGLGFVIGPALGGVLGAVDARLPFWVAGGLSLLNGMYGLFVLPESLPLAKRARFSWAKANPAGAFAMLRAHPRTLALASVKFLNDLAHVAYPATFALYAMHRYHWGPSEIGLTLAMIGVCGVIVQGGLVGRIVRAIGERRALITGLVCGAIGFALYGLASEPWMLIAAIPIASFWGLAGPSGQALITKRVDPSEQGRMQGALASVAGVAAMLGPSLFTGVFAHSIGASAPAAMAGAVFMAAALFVAAALPIALRATRPIAGF